ncbi:MAG: choice-of-anchor J domain-containing protein [Bacteroidia bacterium]
MGVFLCIFVVANAPLRAQYYTETFDTLAAIWSRGWDQQNRSQPPGNQPYWFQGDPGVFSSHDGADTAYVGVNYNSVGGAATISNWLFTPTRLLTNGEKISFWTRTVDHPQYPDRLQVRLSLNGSSTFVGTNYATVGDFSTLLLQVNPFQTTSGYPNSWTQYTVQISGLTQPTSGRIGFRYYVGNGGPGGANSEYIGVDSVAYYNPPAGDLRLAGILPTEYTQIPERQQGAAPFIGYIHNNGSTQVTNASLQVNLFNGSGALVYSQSSAAVPSMAFGEIDTFTVAAAPTLTPGSYTVQYIARHSSSDGDHSNDTLYDHFAITPLTFARDNADEVGDIGIGALIGGYVGQQFHLVQTDNVDSVWVHVSGGYTGQHLAAAIWSMANGRPAQLLGTTDTLAYTTDSAADYILPIHDGRLQIPAGDFVLTMIEFDSTLHISQSSEVFTPGTVWLRWPTAPGADHWNNVERFNLPQYNHALMLRPKLSLCDLVIATTFTPESAPSANDGLATVTASGGQPPYTYAWSTGATAAVATGIGSAPVGVTVTDAAGCRSTGVASLIVGTASPRPLASVSIVPNPNAGLFRMEWSGAEAGVAEVAIVDMLGRRVWESVIVDLPAAGKLDFDLQGQPRGVYFLQMRTDSGTVVRRVVLGE